jgi:hypothetical protein
MKDFEGNNFRELTCDELKEVQGGMKWWLALALMVFVGIFGVACEARAGFWTD